MSQGIMDRMRIADSDLSIPQLKQAIQNGTIPAYVGIPMLEEKIAKEQQLQAASQAGQQQMPIASQVLAKADQMNGIPALQTNLPAVHSAAEGGIIAFDDGGYVPHYAGDSDGSLVGGLTQEELMAMSPEDRARVIQAANDRRGLLRPLAAMADFPGMAYNAAAKGGDYVANAIGIPRLGRALGIYDKDITRVEIPKVGSGSLTPFYDYVRSDISEKNYAPSKDTTGPGMPIVTDMAERQRLTAENARKLGITPSPTPPADKKPAAGPAAPRTGTTPPAPSGGVSSLLPAFNLTEAQFGIEGKDPTMADSAAQVRAAREAFGVSEKPYEEAAKRLGARRSELDTQRGQSKWDALIAAGLAMAAGKSPNALQNIAEGGIKGLQAYNESKDKFLASQEKLDAAEFAMADARNRFNQEGSKAALEDYQSSKKDRNAAKRDFTKLQKDYEVKRAEISTQMRGQDITAQTAREGHQTQERVAATYAKAGAGKQESQTYKRISEIQNSKQALADADILAKSNIPGVANSPYWQGLIAAAQARETQRQAQIKALMTNLSGEERTIMQAGVGGARQMSTIDQQALAWANSNPNDPRAKEIKARLGV
jgi:hypothetical protein